VDEGASPLMNTFLKALTLRFIIYSRPPPLEDEGASPLMNTFLKALTLRFIIYSHPPPSEDEGASPLMIHFSHSPLRRPPPIMSLFRWVIF